jgi:5S rRNA maturation endonuclease (ribonuclease M5)
MNNNSTIQETVEELFKELIMANDTIPIIVEGKKDEAALRRLGTRGEILRLNTGLSILNFCEQVAKKYDEVIILPDWDVKGKQLFEKLKNNFKYNNVKTVKKFWRDFRRFCSKEILEVEYLTKFMGEENDIVNHPLL